MTDNETRHINVNNKRIKIISKFVHISRKHRSGEMVKQLRAITDHIKDPDNVSHSSLTTILGNQLLISEGTRFSEGTQICRQNTICIK